MDLILQSLFSASEEAKKFYQLVMKEIDKQKDRNSVETFVTFPYNKYVLICGAVIKGLLDDAYDIDLHYTEQECNIYIRQK